MNWTRFTPPRGILLCFHSVALGGPLCFEFCFSIMLRFKSCLSYLSCHAGHLSEATIPDSRQHCIPRTSTWSRLRIIFCHGSPETIPWRTLLCRTHSAVGHPGSHFCAWIPTRPSRGTWTADGSLPPDACSTKLFIMRRSLRAMSKYRRNNGRIGSFKSQRSPSLQPALDTILPN